MIAKQKISIHNKFEVVVRDVKTNEEQRAFAYNIVLDNWGTTYANAGDISYSLAYGRGTGELNPSRTTLFNRINSKAMTRDSFSFNDETWIFENTGILLIGTAEAVGETITEVGIGTTTIFSHALLEDSEGNPISIGPKTDTQEITIYATVYIKFIRPENDWIQPVIDVNILNTNFESMYLQHGRQFRSPISNTAKIWAGVSRNIPKTRSDYLGVNFLEGTQETAPSVVGKKRIINPWRFEPGQTGELTSILVSVYSSKRIGSYMLFLEKAPDSIWNGIIRNGVTVGQGDGIIKGFNSPFRDLKDLILKVDGVIQTEGTDFEYCAIPAGRTLARDSFPFENITAINSNPEGEPMDYYVNWEKTDFQSNVDIFSTDTAYHYDESDIYKGVTIDFKEDKNWGIGAFNFNSYRVSMAKLEVSSDNINFELLHEVTGLNTATTTHPIQEFNPPNRKYRYMKVSFGGPTPDSHFARSLRFYTRKNQFEFTNPPANGSEITVDFRTKYIPKDSNYIFKFGLEIDFGSE